MKPDDLTPVTTVETEFEAETKAAVLRSNGIDATVIVNNPSWTGQLSISPSARGASVLVRREDLTQARQLLEQAIEDSVDLDWDEVDVGEREDDLPLRPVNRMPILAMVGFAVAAGILIVSGLLVVVLILQS